MKKFLLGSLLLKLALLAGCMTPSDERSIPQTVDYVDLESYMGRWYLIAGTPTMRDRRAFDALFDYFPRRDGRIDIEFYMRDNGHDAEWLMHRGEAAVLNTESNAEWEVSYTWPLTSQYRILHLENDYSIAVVGDGQGRSVQLLARQAHLPREKFSDMMLVIQSLGYDISKIRRIPHQAETR
jgi:apolipoprotein D and lipocalin family protein